MTAEADRLRRLVRELKADYLICDSVGFASDGRPEDAEVALRYVQCLRRIGVGSLNLAHTNKTDESDKKPFGSTFWHNGARGTWNVKVADASPNEVTLGVFQRKTLGARRPAVGYRFEFGPERTHIVRVDLAHVDELAAELPLWQRIKALVGRQPQSLAAIAEGLGAKLDSVEKAVQRKAKVFTRTSTGLIALVERRSA
jgi:hypothetical protein